MFWSSSSIRKLNFPSCFAISDAEMMLLKRRGLFGFVNGKPEVVVTVQVHSAVDDLAQRVDRILLRLDVVLDILNRDSGWRWLLLLCFERLKALQQLLDDRLLFRKLRSQRRDFALLRPDGAGAGDTQDRRPQENALHRVSLPRLKACATEGWTKVPASRCGSPALHKFAQRCPRQTAANAPCYRLVSPVSVQAERLGAESRKLL